MILRRTLARPTPKIEGIGLHTGAPGWVRLLPKSDNQRSGIILSGPRGESILSPLLVTDTRRCTLIEVAGQSFSTIEHLMSALSGLGITDAVIEFDGPETPILDGSALGFIEHLQVAGIVEIDQPAAPVIIREALDVQGKKGERLIALPAEAFSVSVVLEYPNHSALGTQAASWHSGNGDYASEIAPARTYGFLSEFDQMRAAGLASGASLENCVALMDDGSPDPRTPLRFANEPARHKLLDVIGDLFLVGRPIIGEIIALKPSHAVNCELAQILATL